jgi:uncharacterized membrane protein
MYALHPVTVHFPIGLLLVSSLFTFLALRRPAGGWDTSAYHCLLVGWLAGVIAVLSGTWDAVRQLTGPDAIRDNTLLTWVNLHAFSNIASLVVYGQALLQRRRHPALLTDAERRGGYLRLHLIGALLMLVGGWLGGYLVYQFGLGVRAE